MKSTRNFPASSGKFSNTPCVTASSATAFLMWCRSSASTARSDAPGLPAAMPSGSQRASCARFGLRAAIRHAESAIVSTCRVGASRARNRKPSAYHPVGKLIPGTGMRAPRGDIDDTVYARIRFPAAEAPAYVIDAGLSATRQIDAVLFLRDADPEARHLSLARQFLRTARLPVGQCPSGRGHQGQDIRGATCAPSVDSKIRCRPNNDDVVAVRDGMIQREAWNESFFPGDQRAGRTAALPASAHASAHSSTATTSSADTRSRKAIRSARSATTIGVRD